LVPAKRRRLLFLVSAKHRRPVFLVSAKHRRNMAAPVLKHRADILTNRYRSGRSIDGFSGNQPKELNRWNSIPPPPRGY
jgi:hypothetical protein